MKDMQLKEEDLIRYVRLDNFSAVKYIKDI